MSELDHPCKQTCSGWMQGYEQGMQAEAANWILLQEEYRVLREKLATYELTDLNRKNGARFEAESEYLYIKKIDWLEDKVGRYEAALTWIGAIEIAPSNSWPHYLTIAKVANVALHPEETVAIVTPRTGKMP